MFAQSYIRGAWVWSFPLIVAYQKCIFTIALVVCTLTFQLKGVRRRLPFELTTMAELGMFTYRPEGRPAVPECSEGRQQMSH